MTPNRKPAHWTARHVGIRASCWELVRRVFQVEHELALPAREAGDWHRVEPGDEQPFDLVVFDLGGIEDHVGLIVTPGEMLHSDPKTSSRVERYDSGRFLPRFSGAYRHDRLSGAMVLPGIARMPLLGPLKPAPDLVNVVGLPFINPARDRVEFRVASGTSLLEIVRLTFPLATAEQHGRMGVRIGSLEIAPPGGEDSLELWRKVYPLPGMVVTVTPVPVGIFRTIVGLAAAVAGTYFLGPAIGAQLGLGVVGSAVVTAGVTAALVLGVNLLFNAFVPVRKSKDRAETLLASGWRNDARPYGVVPHPYGKNRQAPPFGTFSYMEVVEDSVFLRALLIHGVGPLVLSDHRIGDTPLYKPESEWAVPGTPEFAFLGVEVEHREGLVGDLPFTIYQHQVIPTDSMGGNVPLTLTTKDEPQEWVTRVAARDAQDLEIILGFPGGISGVSSDGVLTTESIFFDLEYRLIGAPAWTVIAEFTSVARGQTSAFYVSHRWTPPVRGQYEVRLRVNTISDWDADTGDYARNRVEWLQLYAHRPEYPLNFPVPLAATAIRIKGSEQLKGDLDAYNCIVSRVCPDWDAGTDTWITRETQNPASAFRCALQGPGNAKPVPDSSINLVELQRWHERCTEKGLKYHFLHDAEASLPDVLSQIALAGRATWRHNGRQWGVVVDQPREVVSGHVSPRDGWDIEVSRPTLIAFHAFKISFRDETSNYEVRERIIPFPGYTLETATLFETLELPGKTHPDEIWIEARRRQYELIYRPKLYRGTTTWRSMTLARGVQVMFDDGLRRTTTSAFVRAVDTGLPQTIELDEWITQESGSSYEVRFLTLKPEEDEVEGDPPAESIVREIVTLAGRSNLLMLSGFGDMPREGDHAIVAKVAEAGRPVLVSRIDKGENETATLTFVDAAPEIDELTDAEVVPAWDGRVGEIYSPDPDAPGVPIITDIASSSEADGDVHVFVTEGLGSEPVIIFEVDHRLLGAVPWTTVVTTPAAGFANLGGSYVLGDVIEVRTRAKGHSGLYSGYTAIEEHEFGDNDPGVTFFDATLLATESWRYEFETTGGGVVGIHLRYRSGIWADFEDLTSSFLGILTVSPWDASLPELDDYYTFGAIAVLADGTEVGEPVLIVRFDSFATNSLDYSQPGNLIHWLFGNGL